MKATRWIVHRRDEASERSPPVRMKGKEGEAENGNNPTCCGCGEGNDN